MNQAYADALRLLKVRDRRIARLEAGLKTILRITRGDCYPNAMWDAHVMAERLLAGQDHNGLSPSSGEVKS